MKKQTQILSFVTDKGIYTYHGVIDMVLKDQNGKIVLSTIKPSDLDRKPLKRR